MQLNFKHSIIILAIGFLASSLQLISAQTTFKRDGNPLVKHLFTADPSARVFNNRLYVYTSHDQNEAKYFNMIDWHVFSTDNLEDWIDHGPIFSLNEIKWAKKWAWAPDCIARNGKYYFYYPVERTKIGVAVSDSPTGPFVDTLEKPLIDNTDQIEKIGPEPIDPALLIDNDTAYMYFGCRKLKVVKLKANMMELDGEIMPLKIKGTEKDPENFGGYYGEGPWVFKRNDLFYFMYSNGWGKTSTLVYATSKNPLGPFNFEGKVMDPVDSFTSHGSIVEFKGKWYIFYHNMSLSNNNYRRSICFDEIKFDKEGKIIKLNLQD
jgi:beta-xylosidase